jgi:hypothetical protein
VYADKRVKESTGMVPALRQALFEAAVCKRLQLEANSARKSSKKASFRQLPLEEDKSDVTVDVKGFKLDKDFTIHRELMWLGQAICVAAKRQGGKSKPNTTPLSCPAELSKILATLRLKDKVLTQKPPQNMKTK